jgi:hypothetical protein
MFGWIKPFEQELEIATSSGKRKNNTSLKILRVRISGCRLLKGPESIVPPWGSIACDDSH